MIQTLNDLVSQVKTKFLKNKRNQSGSIIPLMGLVAIAGVAVATLISSTAGDFAKFHNVANRLHNWDSSSLASATHISKKSSNFLNDLKNSINESLSTYSYDKNVCEDKGRWATNTYNTTSCSGTGKNRKCKTTTHSNTYWVPNIVCHNERIVDGFNTYTNTVENQAGIAKKDDRARLVNAFSDQMSNLYPTNANHEVLRTLNFGLNQGKNLEYKGIEEVKYINYIQAPFTPRLNGNERKLTSTILTTNQATVLSDNFRNQYTNGSQIKISRTLLQSIFGSHPKWQFLDQNPSLYGIAFDEYGINTSTLPTGIKFRLETTIKTPSNSNAAQAADSNRPNQKYERVATGHLSIEATPPPPPPPPNPPTACPVTGRLVNLTGTCVNTPAALGCPCYCDVNPDVAPTCVPIECEQNDLTCVCAYFPTDARCKVTPPANPVSEPVTKDPETGSLTISWGDATDSESKYKTYVKNPNAPISASNPLYIVNKKTGTFTKIYQDANGALIREIGYNFNDKGMQKAPQEFEVAFYEGGTEDLELTIFSIAPSDLRFGKLPEREMSINGIRIPPGAVLRASVDDGLRKSPGDIDKYDSITVFDPATGVLIGKFSVKDIKNAGLGKVFGNALKEKVTIDERGQKIVSTSNSSELFDKAGSPLDSAIAYAVMQGNVIDRLQSHINTNPGDIRNDTGGLRDPAIDGKDAGTANLEIDDTATFIRALTNAIEQEYFKIKEENNFEINRLERELKTANKKVKRGINKQISDLKAERDKAFGDYKKSFDFYKKYISSRDVNVQDLNDLAAPYGLSLHRIAKNLGFDLKKLNLKGL